MPEHRRLRRPLRPGRRQDRDLLLRRVGRRAARGRPRLVQRPPRGRSLGERGFASYYATWRASALKVKVASPVLTDALKASAIPLNAWGAVGTTTTRSEDYAYAASFELARSRGGRRATGSRRSGLGPLPARAPTSRASGTETLAGARPTGAGLLDLFEERPGPPSTTCGACGSSRPEDSPCSTLARPPGRADTQAVVDAGPWTLPRSIRDAMRAWQFDVATSQMTAAEAVLGAASPAPGRGNGGGRDAARNPAGSLRGQRWRPGCGRRGNGRAAALEAIQQAAAAEPAGDRRGAATVHLDRAARVRSRGEAGGRPVKAFAAGELQQAISESSDAAATWTSAASIGRTRIVSAGLLVLASLLLARMLWVRRRRTAVSPAPDPRRRDATLATRSDSVRWMRGRP